MSNPSPLPDPIGEIQQPAWTPEPWTHYDFGPDPKPGPYIVGVCVNPDGCGPERGYTITSHPHNPNGGTYWPARGVGGRSDGECRANAARIVQCVNALAGIADPAAHLSTLAATVERLEAERDSLRKRVETLHNAVREREDAFAASERAHERTKRQHVVVSCDGRRADHLMPDGVIIATKIVDMREYLRMVDPARLPFMLAQTITAELDEYARSAAALAARTGRAGT